ncbi:MAG: EpsI family protein [Planctomycetota bacterium]|nr:EpsI family protein [Planctomycetota bacterium]
MTQNDVAQAEHSAPARRLLQPTFLIVSALLLIAAISLNAATQKMRLHFKKDPVPQPRDFHDLPPIMGDWLQVSEDEKLDRETEDVLGTDKYVYRDYVNVNQRGVDLLLAVARGNPMAPPKAAGASIDTVADQNELDIRDKFKRASFEERVKMIRDALKLKTPADRKELVYMMQTAKPGGLMDVGLTYYTGLVDTVAHIPDRCYIADGYEPSDYQVPTWNLGTDAAGNPGTLEVRFISFEDQTGSNRVPKFVAYVFNANGSYVSDPLAVRQTLQDLTKRYGYYAKIELMTIGKDPAVATDSMSSFLKAAKPQIETCFPDWKKLTQTR